MRAWLVNDAVRILGESGRADATELANARDERKLVTEVMSVSMTLQADHKNNQMITGKPPSVSDVLHFVKGNKLAHAYAKAKGWDLECSGSQAMGYDCEIK